MNYFGAFGQNDGILNLEHMMVQEATKELIHDFHFQERSSVYYCVITMVSCTEIPPSTCFIQKNPMLCVTAGTTSGFNRHEDLAKKIQEEMEKKWRIIDSKSSVTDERMKDVDCPTCTVHLQAEVPLMGSKTLKYSVFFTKMQKFAPYLYFQPELEERTETYSE